MLVLLSLAACTGPYGAPMDSTIQVNPESFTTSYGSLFFDEDGFGFVAYCEAFVEGPNEFEETVPLNNVEVTAQTDWPGVYLLPEEAVKKVSSLEDGCAADPTADGCSAFYDDATGDYYEISGEYDYADDLRPNMMYASTNNRGVVPFFLFFDSLPYSTEDTSFSVFYSIQVETFSQEIAVVALDED